MSYGTKELEAGFRTVRKNTITIAEEIPETQYGYRAAPDVMSVGEMLAHLAISPQWQMAMHTERVTSVDFAVFRARLAQSKLEEQTLTTKAAIIAALTDGGEAFAQFLGGLTREVLDEVVSFPPPVMPATKTRFEMILGVKEHEMHHRGQLMLIERQLGIVPHITRGRQAAQAAAGAAPAGAAR